VAVHHLLVDAALDFVFYGALRDDVRQRVLDLRDRLLVLRCGRDPLEGGIFEHQPLQRQDALAERRRAH
jgi:hypothetical protein